MVLSCLADAQAALDKAHEEATRPEQQKGRPDPWDLVLRATEVQAAMGSLIAEVTESCAVFGAREDGPSILRLDRDRLQALIARLSEEAKPTAIVAEVRAEMLDILERVPPGTGEVR